MCNYLVQRLGQPLGHLPEELLSSGASTALGSGGTGGLLTPQTPQSTVSWAVSSREGFHQGSAVISQS